jgi:hypothetical protein
MAVFTEVVPVVPGIEPLAPGVKLHFVEPVQVGRERHVGVEENLDSPKNTKSV